MQMSSMLLKAVTTVAITTIASLGADNTLGTWKLNEQKSTRSPAKSVTMVREAVPAGVKVTITWEGANVTWTAKYDGHEYPIVGAPFDTVSIKQVDADTLLIDERKKAGSPFHAAGRIVVSKDGKILTTTTKGIGADGKPFSNTLVYEKQ